MSGPVAVDIAVIGGGPAGLAAALRLARTGRTTALLAPPRPPDERTTALLGASVPFVREIGVWAELSRSAAPLRAIRIVDGTGRLIRAPEVRFEASELGLDAFGYNIPNASLLAALDAAVAASSIRLFPEAASRIVPGEDNVAIETAGGTGIQARLVVAADGRNSAAREAAGIAASTHRYPQAALVTTFAHTLPHDDISTEFHTASGPFTLVPLPGRRSSLVWVERPDEAERLRRLPWAELGAAIEARSASLLGGVTVDGPAQVYPLTALTVSSFAARRIALAGEAAHVLPPIGAQGLNLALRDAAALAQLVEATSGDPGAGALLAAYDRRRRADTRLRAGAVDVLNRSLLTGFLPVQALRGVGLFLAGNIPPLRRLLMRQGLGA